MTCPTPVVVSISSGKISPKIPKWKNHNYVLRENFSRNPGLDPPRCSGKKNYLKS